MYRGGFGDPPETGGWFNNGSLVVGYMSGPSEDGYYAVNSAPCVMGDKVYAVSGEGYVTSWALTSGDPAPGHTDSYALTGLAAGHAGSGLAAGDDGYLYVVAPDPLNTSFNAVYRFNADLTVSKIWHCVQEEPSDPCPTTLRFDHAFAVWGGYLICTNSDNGYGYYYTYKFEQDGTISLVHQLNAGYGVSTYEVISLGNGFFATRDGVLRLT